MAHPTPLALEAGTHAFCDGCHAGSGKTPHILKLDEPKTMYSCSCGTSGNRPFCDGSHTKLQS